MNNKTARTRYATAGARTLSRIATRYGHARLRELLQQATTAEPVFHAENKGQICVMRETALGVEALRIDDWYWKAYAGCFTQL